MRDINLDKHIISYRWLNILFNADHIGIHKVTLHTVITDDV